MNRQDKDKIFGVDLTLYRFHALRKGKKVASVSVFAHSKFDALIDAEKYFPDYDTYDYTHVRFANDGEVAGVVLSKNDKKRKR